VDSDSANKLMDLIRNEFVAGDITQIASDGSDITLVKAEEFS
jgi:hypothetical protein